MSEGRETYTIEKHGRKISIRLPEWLFQRLAKEAKASERTESQQLRYILMQRYGEPEGADTLTPPPEGQPGEEDESTPPG